MKKKLLIIIGIIIGVIVIAAVLLAVSDGGKRAEEEGRKTNPTFHTISEGGACRDGQGDCQAGLTCVNSVCQKP